MRINISYHCYIAFFEEFASLFIRNEFPIGKLPPGINLYSFALWKHTHEIQKRAMEIFGDGTRDPAFFRKFIFRFNKEKTNTPGISRIALLRGLSYWFRHNDKEFLQSIPDKSPIGERVEYMWKEFCKRKCNKSN